VARIDDSSVLEDLVPVAGASDATVDDRGRSRVRRVSPRTDDRSRSSDTLTAATDAGDVSARDQHGRRGRASISHFRLHNMQSATTAESPDLPRVARSCREGESKTASVLVHRRGFAPTLPGVAADRQARVEDVHEIALGLPHVTVVHGARGNPVYQVGGRSFIFFRTPRPDAVDPETGKRLPDVIVFWVESEADKQALVQDPTVPFFSTPHFDGHNSVLVQASRLEEITRGELAELVQDAWLARASARRKTDWLAAHAKKASRS
jgi:hypothetical protein